MTSSEDPRLKGATSAQLTTLLSLAFLSGGSEESVPAIARDLVETRRLLSQVPAGGFGTAERLLDAICVPRTSLDGLLRMKETAKELLATAATREQQDAVTLVYHAAVAAALAEHGARITSRPIEERMGLYESLAVALRGQLLGDIFLRAVDRAVKQMTSPDPTGDTAS